MDYEYYKDRSETRLERAKDLVRRYFEMVGRGFQPRWDAPEREIPLLGDEAWFRQQYAAHMSNKNALPANVIEVDFVQKQRIRRAS